MMKLRNCISFKYTSLFGIYAKNTFRKRWDKVKSLFCVISSFISNLQVFGY